MNNIEYRAWLIEEKKFVDLDAIIFKNGEAEAIYYIKSVYKDGANITTNYEHIKEGFKLMQFTGLTDMNGVKVFDGDILRYTEHDGYLMPNCLLKITFENSAFGFIPINYYGAILPYFRAFADVDCLKEDLLDYCEIIGNVYENKELLEETNE